MPDIAHRDILQLTAKPGQVRSFLRYPERIADYYPNLIDYGTIEEGKVFWCNGEAGVALFEFIEERCSDEMITMSIVTSLSAKKPYTADNIKADPLISMVEEWAVEATPDGGTQITKTWLDVKLHQMEDLPIVDLIRETAVVEHEKIVTAWNNAAK